MYSNIRIKSLILVFSFFKTVFSPRLSKNRQKKTSILSTQTKISVRKYMFFFRKKIQKFKNSKIQFPSTSNYACFYQLIQYILSKRKLRDQYNGFRSRFQSKVLSYIIFDVFLQGSYKKSTWTLQKAFGVTGMAFSFGKPAFQSELFL